MGGEKILAVNRTSSGILATILSLVSKDSNVVTPIIYYVST